MSEPLFNRNNFTQIEVGMPNLPTLLRRVVMNTDEVVPNSFYEFPGNSETAEFLNWLYPTLTDKGFSDIYFIYNHNGGEIRARNQFGDMQNLMPPMPHRDMKNIRELLFSKCDFDIKKDRSFLDGSFFMRESDGRRLFGVRVNVSPTIFGFNIVQRILRQKEGFTLNDVYMPDDLRETFRRAMRQSQGLILISGPTGSGKTTTLFGAIQEVNSPDKHLITIEDPVENLIPGTTQISINGRERTFDSALRAAMRQDPDIALVGEIRDDVTGEAALKLANTGHLVLSTIHTSSSAQIPQRLAMMGVNPINMSQNMLLFTAQRLGRQLCRHCAKEYTPQEGVVLPTRFPARRYHVQGDGCSHCNGRGILGKIPVLEIALNTQDVADAIDRHEFNIIEGLFKHQEQYKTLIEQALIMSEQGLLDFHEACGIGNTALL